MKTTNTYNKINAYIGFLGEMKKNLVDGVEISEELLRDTEAKAKEIVEQYKKDTSRTADDVYDEMIEFLQGIETKDLVEMANNNYIMEIYTDVDDVYSYASDLLEALCNCYTDPRDLQYAECFDEDLNTYDEDEIREELLGQYERDMMRAVYKDYDSEEFDALWEEYKELKEQA